MSDLEESVSNTALNPNNIDDEIKKYYDSVISNLNQYLDTYVLNDELETHIFGLIESYKPRALEYLKYLDSTLKNFANHPLSEDILDLNTRTFWMFETFESSIRVNKLLKKNETDSNLILYVYPLLNSIKLDYLVKRDTDISDIDSFEKTIGILEHYGPFEYKHNLFRALNFILCNAGARRRFKYSEMNNYLSLFTDPEFEAKNKTEVNFYYNGIGSRVCYRDYGFNTEVFDLDRFKELFSELRKYPAIKEVNITYFSEYLKIIGNNETDLKYQSLFNMGHIKEIVVTYNLTKNYVEPLFGDGPLKNIFFDNVNLAMSLSENSEHKCADLTSWCSEVQRMIKSGTYDDELKLMFGGGGR